MPLTDAVARSAKPKIKPDKLSDDCGLYLLLNPNGSKLWRQKYRMAGKEKLPAHCVYDEISLKQAGDDARRLLAR